MRRSGRPLCSQRDMQRPAPIAAPVRLSFPRLAQPLRYYHHTDQGDPASIRPLVPGRPAAGMPERALTGRLRPLRVWLGKRVSNGAAVLRQQLSCDELLGSGMLLMIGKRPVISIDGYWARLVSVSKAPGAAPRPEIGMCRPPFTPRPGPDCAPRSAVVKADCARGAGAADWSLLRA